jgi:hypothetical protein
MPVTVLTRLPRRLALAAILVAAGLVAAGAARAAEIAPLGYEHPGLVVDLGVGLWAWPVPADADGDGDLDLVVSCPDKPSNGVWLFERPGGDGPFPVFRPGRRLSATVHYVMPSVVGDTTRVLGPGVEFTDFLRVGTAAPRPLPVAANWYTPRYGQPKGPKVRHNQWRLADVDDDGRTDLVIGIEDWSDYGWDDGYDATGRWTHGPLHGFVFVLPGLADGGFGPPRQLEADGRPIDVFGCPSPNLADFDGDGDLDLLCGSFLDGCTYFANRGTRTAPAYAAGVALPTADGSPLRMELQMIVPVACDWDRDGRPDLVIGDEDGRVAVALHTGVVDAAGTPRFTPPVYLRQEADRLKCGALATPVGVDWDGDGDDDILAGNTAGFIEWFENLSGPRVPTPRWAAPRRLDAGGKPFRVMAGPNGSIEVGLLHLQRRRLGRRRPPRHRPQRDHGRRDMAAERGHQAGPASRGRPAGGGGVGRRPPAPCLGVALSPGQRPPHPVADHAGGPRRDRRRTRGPGDARPRGLPRPLPPCRA